MYEMKRNTVIFIAFFNVFGLPTLVKSSEDDRRNWIDPTDMLNYNPVDKTTRSKNENSLPVENSESLSLQEDSCCKALEVLQKRLENSNIDKNESEEEVQFKDTLISPEIEKSFLRRYVNKLLHQFAVDSADSYQTFQITVKLDSNGKKLLQEFAAGSKAIKPQEIDKILDEFFYQSMPTDEAGQSIKWYDNMDLKQFLYLSLILVSLILFYKIFTGSVWQGVIFCLIALIILSAIWERKKDYEESLARRHAKLVQYGNYPPECKPKDLNWWDWVSWKIDAYSGLEENCEQYYKSIMLDPIWEISPTEAVSRAIVSLFSGPFGILGKNIGHFYTELRKTAPPFVMWFLLPITVIAPVIILLICCGYQLSWFGFSLRPSLPNSSLTERVEDVGRRLTYEPQNQTDPETSQLRFIDNQNKAVESVSHREKSLVVSEPMAEVVQPQDSENNSMGLAITQSESGCVNVNLTIPPRKCVGKYTVVADSSKQISENESTSKDSSKPENCADSGESSAT